MANEKLTISRSHGPENTEHELRKAYHCVIDAGTTYFWDKKPTLGVNPYEVFTLYKHAYNCYRRGHRLAAERWARTAKHLSRAFSHEAKIAYLEPKVSELPFLIGVQEDEYGLYHRNDTTSDLLDSLAGNIPPGMTQIPFEMSRYLSRARKHLEVLDSVDYKNELLRSERIQAAHEYGRVLECMALAYEAEGTRSEQAA